MNDKILFVGLDVDDKTFHASLLGNNSEEIFEFSCKPTIHSLTEKFQKFLENGFELRICYEASYIGFSLCRDLRKLNFNCQVVEG